jgi:hypothetical protein
MNTTDNNATTGIKDASMQKKSFEKVMYANVDSLYRQMIIDINEQDINHHNINFYEKDIWIVVNHNYVSLHLNLDSCNAIEYKHPYTTTYVLDNIEVIVYHSTNTLVIHL